MPTYEYECQECHQRLEAVQSFSDPALTICPVCGGELRKVFSAVGIVFKGSGFYKTDARATSSAAATPSSDAAKKKTDAPAPSPAPTPAPSPAPAAKTD